MKASDSLFSLIHSLTDNEKLYFRSHSSKHVIGNKNKYEKLFDIYCQLQIDNPYDEAQLKRLLKGKSFGKNLAVEKKQLYDLIIETMRTFHADKTPESRLIGSIADLRFLYDKGLHDEARKELEKGFKLAQETENLSTLIFLYNIKLRLTRFTQTNQDIEDTGDDFAEEMLVLRKLNAERRIAYLRRKVYNLYITSKLKPRISELKEEINSITSETASLSLTFSAQSSLFAARALIAEKEGEYSQAMKLYEEMLELWEKNPLKLHEPNAYIRIFLGNYLACAHHCERFDVFPVIIEKIEKLPCENTTEEADSFRFVKQIKLIYLLNSKVPNGAGELVSEIEKGLKRYNAFISRNVEIDFRMNICLLYLQQQKYNQLIDMLNRTYLFIGHDKTFYNLIFYLRFIEIMAHISLNDYDLVNSLFDSLERWLRDNQMNNQLTSVVIKLLKNVGGGNRPENIEEQLTSANCPPDMTMLKEITVRWLTEKFTVPADFSSVRQPV